MRPLVLDEKAKKQVATVTAYAAEHPYIPGQPTPGDNPNFVVKFGTYRSVFTFTHINGLVYRHLSVSVPSVKYPNLTAVLAIADLFGFTGWDKQTIDHLPDGWMGSVKEDEHCIVVAQPIEQ